MGHQTTDSSWRTENVPVRRVRKRTVAVFAESVERAIGFAATLLAVLCQIVLVATISLPPSIVADPIGSAPICHGDGDTQAPQQPEKSDHHSYDCALCVLCLSHALSLAVPAPVPVLPEPQSIETVQLAAVWSRAPPVRLAFAPQPRGPPPLI